MLTGKAPGGPHDRSASGAVSHPHLPAAPAWEGGDEQRRTTPSTPAAWAFHPAWAGWAWDRITFTDW